MRVAVFIGVCSFMWSVVISSDSTSVSVDISDRFAHVGDNVTILCRTANLQADFVDWFKGVTSHRSNDVSELIATNNQLTPLYASLRRYKTRLVKAGRVRMFIIHIYGVTHEDTGVFGCSVPSKNNIYSSARLEVYRQLISVSFKNHTANTPLTFWEGVPRRLHCRLRGSVPAAKVRFIVNGREQNESESSDVVVRTQCKGEFPSKRNCPLHYYYDVIARTSVTLTARADDGSDVTCEAFVPDSRLQRMRVTERVQLLYSARLECGPEVHLIKRNARNISIPCSVYANPLPSRDAVTWRFAIGQYDYEIYAGEKISGYKVDWQIISHSKAKVRLIIDEIFSIHFTTYQLIIRDNVRTPVTERVILQEDVEADRWIRSTSSHRNTPSIIIFISILLQVLCINHR